MNSFLEMKAELEAVKSRMKNAEQLRGLEDRIMEVPRSEERTESQTKTTSESAMRDPRDNTERALCAQLESKKGKQEKDRTCI